MADMKHIVIFPLNTTSDAEADRVADMNPRTLVYGVSRRFWNVLTSQDFKLCGEGGVPHVHLHDDGS
jgi:hypothetical protein